MENSSSRIICAVPLSKPEDCEGETPIYREPRAVNGLTKEIKRIPHVKTLQDLHDYCGKTYENSDCLGMRTKLSDGTLGPFVFNSYKSIYNTSKKAGSAILNLDLAPIVTGENGLPDYRMIAIYAKNRMEWTILDIAACLYGITVIPIFDALAGEALSHIFNQTGCTNIFTAEANVDRFLKDAVEGKLGKLSNIICLNNYTFAQKELAKQANITLMSWEEFLSNGENILSYPPVTPDTLFSISYTSGTTGNQKAAIVTQGNLITAIAGAEEHSAKGIDHINQRDVYISHLPMAHTFERGLIHILLSRGTPIGIFSGDPRKLLEDIQTLKPTMMTGVPIIFNRIYEDLKSKVAKITNDPSIEISTIDSSVISQLKEVVGGRLKFILSAGAPVAPHVQYYLRIALGVVFSQSFGQTEAVNSCFAQHVDDNSNDNVGGVLTHVEFKLVDVTEMNYTVKDKGPNGEPMPRGEVCLRGGPVFKGYLKEPVKTAETIDEQGWSHTGDIACLLPNGAIKIIDRRKNILKLAQGEYIAPEMIENVYRRNKFVEGVFVYADPYQCRPVAVVIPHKERLETLGKELGFENLSFEELCKERKVIEYILEDLKKTGRSGKLLGYELASNIYLESNSFLSLGLLTDLQKFKREAAREHYKDVFQKLYAKSV